MRALAGLLALAAGAATAADFRVLAGHGGPVMDVAVSTDGRTALTASFDNSVGVWDIASGEPRWLDGHAAAVKTVALLPEGRAASGGDDFAIHVWDLGTGESVARLEGHRGQVADLAVSPDGGTLASASWDGTIALWTLATGERAAVLDGHGGAVNAVVFASDNALYSAAADGTIREWDLTAARERRRVANHGFGVNTLVLGDDWLAYGATDGGTRVLDLTTGIEMADLTLERRPILSMALSPDGGALSVGDGEGFVMTVETDGWRIAKDFRAAATGPVWALAYTSDGDSLIGGGIDDSAVVWPVMADLGAPILGTTPRGFLTDPSEMTNGERQFRRKCSVCHSLTDDGARRAGPTLAGIIGRRPGTVEGYAYSRTVDALDFVWNETTIDALFDVGPDHYIPGSKMPQQVIAKPEDRRDLIEFLKNNT